MTKNQCENLILRAIEKAKENGFNVFVASDEEGNNFNEIMPISLFYGDSNEKSIVMGVYRHADESEFSINQ